MTRKYAVLGSPIEHSLSPLIHNYIFQALGTDASYDRFEVKSELSEFLEGKSTYSGFSVTMPLKDLAFDVAAELSSTAINTSSVNTLLKVDGGFAGFNTDVFGIQAAIGFEPKSVSVLGSGATSRSALYAFPKAKKYVFARNQQVANALADKFQAERVSLLQALESEVVISTFPKGVLPELIPENFSLGTLLDVSYVNPKIPANRYVSGLEMLMQQAVAQQRIFQSGDELKPLPGEQELILGLRELLFVAK